MESAPAEPVRDPVAEPVGSPAQGTVPVPLSMRAVLGIVPMRRLWIANLISFFGDYMALFAVISVLTFRLHAAPQQVTGVQIAYLLPIGLLGIVAGVFVDRWPLKPTLVASDLIRSVLVLLLFFSHKIWHYYAAMAAISVVSSFFGPAQGVAVRSVVPMHGLRSANALMQQVMFGVRIIGPPIAAFLVWVAGAAGCYLVDFVSFLASAALIGTVAISKLPSADAPPTGTATVAAERGLARFWSETQEGLKFIFGHAGLLFVVLAMAAAMFVLGCFGPLVAVYVRENLHAATNIFGATSTLIGVGIMVGMNVVSVLGKNLKNEHLVYAGLLGIAAGLALMAGVTLIWTTFVAALIIGIAVACIIIPAQTLMQAETPPSLMGRVGATFGSIVLAAQVSGLTLSGFLANWIGVRGDFAVCVGLLIVLTMAGQGWNRSRVKAG